MAEKCEEQFEQLHLDKGAFSPGTLEDELRVDRLCAELLRKFYDECLAAGMPPDEATGLAQGADYFVRDFVISIMQRNIFTETPGIVRQFAGNWYIITTMEPNGSELAGILAAVKSFYRFLHGHRLISTRFLQIVEQECDDLAYYEERIETFWAISGDGYLEWERECSIKEQAW